jgi:predicted nucleic acid-binding protein
MNAFVDSSVLLRKLFGEPDTLAEWPAIEAAYASRLVPVEVGRVIDRCRLMDQIDDEDVAALHQETQRLLRSIDVLALSEQILRRAAEAMPTILGTLDSIHLATALEIGRHIEKPLVLATHDAQLARAARAFGLEVVGA